MGGGAVTGRRKRRELLPEIEGLRGLAVVTVLVYHAKFGLSGGYVGVDVFFVVSGFLITRLLVHERESKGRISLSGFYARRARRLLPAATVVLLAIVIASYLLLNPLRAHDTAVDAGWAAGFLANIHFARIGTDYLASSAAPSMLQHWWSLAIEEQFYLVWPGLLTLAWGICRRVTVAAVAVCATVAVGSFAIGLWLTNANPVWAYFAPWARAWELAVGGLCAFLWSMRRRIAGRALLGWAGLAAIGASAVLFDSSTPFPGIAALLPVLGTAAVILSIGAQGAPGRLLALPLPQWVGGRSYGLYLWHWPLLVLLTERYGSDGRISPVWRAGALLASVALAALMYVVLENPLRHLPALTRSPTRSLAVGVAMVGLVLGAVRWSTSATGDVQLSTGYVAPTLPLTAPPTVGSSAPPDSASGTGTSPTDTAATGGAPSTAAAPDPLTVLNDKVAKELQPLIAASAQQELVPDNITPPISKQHKDSPSVWGDGCLVGFFQDTSGACEYGDLSSKTTIALFGDSHVDQWFPAAQAVAVRNHWKLVVMSKSKCAIVGLDVLYDGTRTYPQCSRWRPKALARVSAPDVQVVVITQWRQHYHVLDHGTARLVRDDEWRAALSTTITTLQQAGKKVLLLGDTPFAHALLDQCMTAHPHNLTRCNFDRPTHVEAGEMAIERDLAASLGAEYYDTNQWFCANDVCPAVIGNLAVYLDDHHITNTYGEFLTPYFELLLQHVLTS